MENIETAKDIQTGDRVQLKGGEWVTVDRWDQMASKQTLMLSELKRGPSANRDGILALAREGERLGLLSAMIADHIVLPVREPVHVSLVNNWPNSRIAELTPWRWSTRTDRRRQTKPVQIVATARR